METRGWQLFSVEQSVPEQLNYCCFVKNTDLQRIVVTPYENTEIMDVCFYKL